MVVYIFPNQLNKTILFVGGGLETVPGIQLAKSKGLHVVVSDQNPNAPGMEIADDRILASTYNIEQTLDAVTHYHNQQRSINGVMCMATDVPLTVASIADHLGLPGIPVTAAQLTSDKMLMKDCFKENGLSIPWYCEIFNSNELETLVQQRGFPLVIKPVDSRGARGVLRLTEGIDLDWAFSLSKSYSPTGRVMVEEYLEGPQVSTESLVVNGRIYTIGFSDRNYEFLDTYAPYIIENGGDLPSYLPQYQQQLIRDEVEKTAKVLGITNGVIKGDMVLCQNKAYIIEVATRLSGGYFCSHEIPLNTGVDFVGSAIKLTLGETIKIEELSAKFNQPVSQRYFFPNPGKIIKINIPKWVQTNHHVKMCQLRFKPGDIIPELTEHPARAGVVITTGETKQEATQLAQRVVREVEITTL
jgi:biotin carboxylase